MIWGVEGKEGVNSERLKPLGLYCTGGGSHKGIEYFSVYLNNKRYEISKNEFDNIEKWLRKQKLKKLNEKLQS